MNLAVRGFQVEDTMGRDFQISREEVDEVIKWRKAKTEAWINKRRGLPPNQKVAQE